MTEPTPHRSTLLLVVAAAMGLTIVGLLVVTALAQNRYNLVADIQAFNPADGTELWSERFDVTRQPRFAGKSVVFASDDRVFALDADGELQWSTAVAGAYFASPAEEYVAVHASQPEEPSRVVLLDGTDGSVLWERPGDLRLIKPKIAVISRTARVVLVDPASGENLHRFKKRRSDTIVGGIALVARLRKGTVTVYPSSGEPIQILEDLPKSASLLGVEDGAVVISRRTHDSGRVVSGHDPVTGAEVWQLPESKYQPPPPNPSVAMFLGTTPWLTAPDGSVAATLGQEADSVEGAVTYLSISGDTYAVEKTSGRVLWTRANKRPVAATTGMVVFKHRVRYEVVEADTGATLAEVSRERGLNVHAAAGRVLMDGGSIVYMVEAEGTTTELFSEPGQLREVSAHYAAVLQEIDDDSSGLVVIELETGQEVINRSFERIYDIAAIEDDKLRLRHPHGGTEVDLSTGETKPIGEPDSHSTPEMMLMNPTVLVFDSERESLLWTTPAISTTSVAFLDETLVLSTPRFKHRDP